MVGRSGRASKQEGDNRGEVTVSDDLAPGTGEIFYRLVLTFHTPDGRCQRSVSACGKSVLSGCRMCFYS